MKQKPIVFIAAALLFAACASNEKKDEAPQVTTAPETTTITDAGNAIPPLATDSASMAQMMKDWQDFATPGPLHSWMAKYAGTWVADSVKQWMDPAQPPGITKATEVISMSMNGRYQITDFSATMMGQPMKGYAMMGYDNMKKKFVLSWIDELGTGIVNMEGTYDEASQTLNLSGKQSDPTRKMQTDIRQQLVFHDDNSYTMSMFGTGPDGKSETKFMEGTFKRKKK